MDQTCRPGSQINQPRDPSPLFLGSCYLPARSSDLKTPQQVPASLRSNLSSSWCPQDVNPLVSLSFFSLPTLPRQAPSYLQTSHLFSRPGMVSPPISAEMASWARPSPPCLRCALITNMSSLPPFPPSFLFFHPSLTPVHMSIDSTRTVVFVPSGTLQDIVTKG